MPDKQKNPRKQSYAHMHMHDHDSDNTFGNNQIETPASTAEDLALLKYMLEHNRQHGQELSEIGGRLRGAGYTLAAELINEAVEFFSNANVKLEKAVGSIDMEG